MQLTVPDLGLAARFAVPDPALPPGWSFHPSDPSGSVLVSAGAPDPAAGARWIVEWFAAMGAPMPTGRFRLYHAGVVTGFNRPN